MTDFNLIAIRRSNRLIVAILCATAIVYSAAVAAPAPIAAHPHPAGALQARPANPHIRGVPARPERPIKNGPDAGKHEDPHKPLDKRDHERHWDRLHHHWYYGWSYITWINLHRGLGAIRGVAYNADGVPESGISLALRTSAGKIFGRASSRHITRSGPGGNFIMSGVRIGGYRVRAHIGKTAGSTDPIHVHAGQVTFVSVKV